MPALTIQGGVHGNEAQEDCTEICGQHSLKAWDIAKAGAAVTLKVRDRDELLGTIEIGQGTFGWKSARGKKGFKRIAWRKLADKLDDIH